MNSREHYRIGNFELGVTTLAEVGRELGATAEPEVCGEFNYSPNCLCFVAEGAKDRSHLVLNAGPLGSWSTLTSFRLLYADFDADEDPNLECASPNVLGAIPLRTGSGLALGMPRSQAGELLGLDISPGTERVELVAVGEILGANGRHDAQTRVELSFRNGLVVQIFVEYTEST